MKSHSYRHYDFRIGRWISEDPIGFDGGFNVFKYASNNPINLSDSHGEYPIAIFIAGLVRNAAAGYLLSWKIDDLVKYKNEREKLDQRRIELLESLKRKNSDDNCHDSTQDEERELKIVMGKIEAYNGIIRDQRNDIISDLKDLLIGLGLNDYLGTAYDYINSEKAFW